MLFKTSLDKTAIIITILITLLFVIIIVTQFFIIGSYDSYQRAIYVTIILLILYCLAFLFRPTAYKVTGDLLIICRPFKNVRIKRTDIRKVAVINKEEIGSAIRTFGVGGVFGYYGCFASFKLGSMTWYATRKDNAVLITMENNRKILVTPDEREAFVAAFSA